MATSSGIRHCELCRAWGFKECPYETIEECDKINGRMLCEDEGCPHHGMLHVCIDVEG